MGQRTSYPPGTFSWVDLATPDPDAARSFYTSLFGWQTEEVDAGDGAVYTMCRVDGDAVCGLSALPDETRAGGFPPSWMGYVTVTDADATAKGAAQLGGTVVAEAFDVLDAGRMAVLGDSQGAVFAVWQPGARIGAERVNDVGCLCMNELITPDLQGARSFYEGLFGWTTEIAGPAAEGVPAGFATNAGAINASFFAGAPAHWRACFTVASTDEALERVRELGGHELRAPVDIGHGSLAVARDPQGAVFALFAGEVDP